MNKTALITGASKRIGRSITFHLANKGWNIAVHFNDSEKEAMLLAKQLETDFPGQKFRIFKANLADINDVFELFSSVQKEFSEIHLLVNNASVFEKGYLRETSPELFARQIDINLKAPFFLTRKFANNCASGNIINFVDTRINSNKSDYIAYSLSKKGLWELTKMAALELAPNIRVNAIAPGVTLAPADKDDYYLQNLAQTIPMKKPGGVEPILKSIDFILENNHLTGQLIFADGGENLGKNA